MRAFIYCRVSTREQATEDHYSLENQEQRCREYIKSRNWSVAKLCSDVGSGKDTNRSGFQELLKAISEEKIDVVVVFRLDRLSRNVRDIYDFIDLIKKSKVAFASTTDNFDTTTPMGLAMLGVAAVFAQLTREMIADNTRDGLLRRAEAGHFNGNKTKLYGYDYSKDDRRLNINEKEAATLHQVFDWFTEHKWGIEKIARVLNRQGIPTKTGIQWSPQTIAALLRNQVYCGEVRANGKFVPGQHDLIIAHEQFKMAQAIIESRAPLPPRSHDSPHLLSGIAHCGMCGRRLTIHSITKNNKKYVSYLHKSDIKVGEGNCEGLSKSASLLERAVIDQIEQMSASKQLQDIVLEDVQRRSNQERVPMLKERDKVLHELDSMGKTFTLWANRLDQGKIDDEQFNQHNAKLLDRKRQLQERLAELGRELAEDEQLEVTLAEVRNILQDFPAVWNSLEFEERREVLRLLIESLKVFKTHAELKLLFLDPIRVPLNPTRKATARPV